MNCKLLENFSIDVALYCPEIPANTGNIGRLCVGAGCTLHIIGRPSFLMRDKEIRRAGLDYWKKLNLIEHHDEKSFIEYAKENNRNVIPVSKYGKTAYFEYVYKKNDILVFGKESTGLSQVLIDEYKDNSVYIQMSEDIRSINLSNSVAIVLYEAWRQAII